jgi:hypothetical protein
MSSEAWFAARANGIGGAREGRAAGTSVDSPR